MPSGSTCSLQIHLLRVVKLHPNFSCRIQRRTPWRNSPTMKSVVTQNCHLLFRWGMNYYGIKIALEATLHPWGFSVVLKIPMNSKSSLFNVYQAIPLYQPNGDNKTASLYQLQKTFLAVSTDNSRFAELDSSILQQCSGNNRIKLCRKGFSTTAKDILVCLSSLLYNYDIPSWRNCPVNSVLLPDALMRSN